MERALHDHREEAARVLAVADADCFKPVVVPFRTREVVRLSEESRRSFEGFLRKISERAFVDEAQAGALPLDPLVDVPAMDTPPSPAEGLLARVCGACGGVCCHRGGDHAFLDVEALRQFRSTRHGLTVADVISLYTERLPEEHYEGACVFQGLTGCTLPRTLRAPLCNGYQCSGLKDARRHAEDSGSLQVFVVARHDNRIMRSAFVDLEGTRTCDLLGRTLRATPIQEVPLGPTAFRSS